jgi:hypothetical protein
MKPIHLLGAISLPPEMFNLYLLNKQGKMEGVRAAMPPTHPPAPWFIEMILQLDPS